MYKKIAKKKWVSFLLFTFLFNFLFAQFNTDLYLQTSEINHLMINYYADKDNVMRYYSTNVNNQTFKIATNDNVHNSPERRKKLLELISNYITALNNIDFNKISKNGQVDYILFQRNLEDEKYILTEQNNVYSKIEFLFPFAIQIYELENKRKRGYKPIPKNIAKQIEEIKNNVIYLKNTIQIKDSLEKKIADFSILEINSIRGALKNYVEFYNLYDPLFTWWVGNSYSELDSLLKVYAQSIKKFSKINTAQMDDGSGIIGNPIGRTELIRQLKNNFINYTPEELVEIANKEFAWCENEMMKASNEMGFKNDWKAALEKVKNSYIEPGEQPQKMLELYNESIQFLETNKLLDIPPLAKETWRMFMMSPEMQKVAPFFLGGESLLISYPTNNMTYSEKLMTLRGNNPHFSRAVIHHELIAGHHLQHFMNNRFKVYRNFETPFWHEGNALYWEFLLWDLKFPTSPEDKVGMLFWRMHRCARIIFSLNYHLNIWSPKTCIDFLVDKVGHERLNAAGEVRRSFTGGYGPLYQIAYMVGGLQFWQLKKELVDSKKLTYKSFHNAILHENSMPIELLRALLLNLPLEKNYATNWRFYN